MLFADAFGVLRLQIPVEGGHRGGDLTVRSKFGVAKLESSQDNDSKYYLSASFIDCTHELSPLTEGCSLVLIYYLVWKKPLIVAPHRMNLPTFVASLNTVQEILNPWQSPTENYNTELLVIPLTNDYAKTPLQYSNLRGTDKLMANLLQSTNSLEVRLATLIHYKAGLAYDERRMNLDREGYDDGLPESPLEQGLKDFPIVKSKRFVAEVMEECFSIEEIYLMSGKGVAINDVSSISWKGDYIFNNTQSVKDLFDDSSPPDKEDYDRYHEVDDLELRQWWYKPIIIFWPKQSTAIECRRQFSIVVNKLKSRVSQQQSNETERMALLLELRKVINYHNRHGKINEDDDDDESDILFDSLPTLFFLCNKLKAKEEGLSLCNYYIQNARSSDWTDVIPEIAKFVNLVGSWESCRAFFNSVISSSFHTEDRQACMVQLTYELLKVDSSLCNVAAAQVFKNLFNPRETLTNELFTTKINNLVDDDWYGLVILDILLLQHLNLLENGQELLGFTTFYLENVDISSEIPFFIERFCATPLVVHSSIGKLPQQLQSSLVFLCHDFLDKTPSYLDVRSKWPACPIDSWIKLFDFVGHRSLIDQLVDKICTRPSVPTEKTDAVLRRFIKSLLANKEVLKSGREQLKRTRNILLHRKRYEIRQSVAHLKTAIARWESPSTPFEYSENIVKFRQSKTTKLRVVINFHNKCVKNIENLSPEETEEEFITVCDLIEMAGKLASKEQGVCVIQFIVDLFPKAVWLRDELVSVLASFIASVGWTEFDDTFDSIKNHILEKKNVQKLCIGLTNELLEKKLLFCENAALNLFEQFLSVIELPCITDQEFFHRHFASFLSSIDERHRALFFHVVLLLDSRDNLQEVENLEQVLDMGFQFLQNHPIDATIHHFVKRFLTNSESGLSTLPFDQLTPICQTTLTSLCSKFFPQSVDTEDLLNWMRLIVYMGKAHLKALMEKLCFSRGYAQLRKLLATEEFLTDPQLKTVREHPILIDWKRRQEKESFIKLFIPRTSFKNCKKRKGTSEDSTTTRRCEKRLRIENTDQLRGD